MNPYRYQQILKDFGLDCIKVGLLSKVTFKTLHNK